MVVAVGGGGFWNLRGIWNWAGEYSQGPNRSHFLAISGVCLIPWESTTNWATQYKKGKGGGGGGIGIEWGGREGGREEEYVGETTHMLSSSRPSKGSFDPHPFINFGLQTAPKKLSMAWPPSLGHEKFVGICIR